MAKMVPSQALNVPKYSREDEMFYALKEKLSDDYFVFYSFHVVDASENRIEESETDFVIFCPDKGILCIEAKNGRIRAEERTWYYSSGKKIWGGAGPFEQASNEKWSLYNRFIMDGKNDIVNNCKFMHAVWLPSYSEADLCNGAIKFPAEAERKLTLTSDALLSPQEYIEKIFNMNVQNDRVKTCLTDEQINYILYSVLCPTFDIIPSIKADIDLNNSIFNRLLDEQKHVLDYLEEQHDAVINGVAGSGKTLIAVEKARRCSRNSERTLFLCFNRYLKDYLKQINDSEFIQYFTIDGFVYSLIDVKDESDTIPDDSSYREAVKILSDMYLEEKFPYKNVIIDEGQDFGQQRIEKSKIVETLKTIITSEEIDGCFYIFYDKLQFVQGKRIPDYITDADCRMSLYKNCRNTENIAVTSLRPFSDIRKPKLGDMVVKGDSTKIFYACEYEDSFRIVENCVVESEADNIRDIVILTCAPSVKESILSPRIKGDKIRIGNHNILFTTCKKFKGLEADVIVLVDISFAVMNSDENNNFYVGCSRAKNRLYLLSSMDNEQLIEVYRTYKGKKPSNNVKKSFATFLNAKYVEMESL